MRKTLSMVLTLAMILSLFTGLGVTAGAAGFGDMPDEGHWSYVALQAAVDNGLMRGDNGLIRPNDSITRAEAAAIVNRAFGAKETSPVSFNDVAGSAWYHNDVSVAVHMKTFNGTSDVTFDPTANITREQAFTMLARALKLKDGNSADLKAYTDGSKVSSWAVAPVAAMVKAGYVNGSNGKLNLKGYITREEFAQIMYNAVGQYITEAGTYTGVSAEGNVLIRAAGVTLKDATVSGDLIVGDGVGDGDVTLDNVTLQGRLVIRGGGVNSIKIVGNGTYKEVVIAKVDGEVRVYADGVQVETVAVADGKADSNIILEGAFESVSIEAENVTVNASSSDLATTINNASIKGAGSQLVIGSGTKVTNIAVSTDKASVEVFGEVDTVNVSGNNVTITAKTGGKVNSVTTSAANTTVSGSGTVSSVTAESGASGTSVSTGNTEVINNSSGDVKVGDSTVPSGSTGTTPATGGDGGGGGGGGGGNGDGSADNYGNINDTDSYNFKIYTTVGGAGAGRVVFNKSNYIMEAVLKNSITFSGDMVTDICAKDIDGLGIDGARSFTSTRSASSVSGMSADYSHAVDNFALSSVSLTAGGHTVGYSIGKRVYDDGIVKFTATPDSLSNAKLVWTAISSKLDCSLEGTGPNGLTASDSFSGGEITFGTSDKLVLDDTLIAPNTDITVGVTGADDTNLNAVLTFLKTLNSGDLVGAVAAMDLICTNSSSLAIVID